MGRTTLRDGSARFCGSSLQRGWITSEEGRVLEDVFVSDAKRTIYFLGRPQMVEESGNTLVASPFQPLFHVRHGVGGSEEAPLNLWSIVLLTDAPDPRYATASRSSRWFAQDCCRGLSRSTSNRTLS
jgi:hypothetical protein